MVQFADMEAADPRSQTFSQQQPSLRTMSAVRSSQCNYEQYVRYIRRGYASLVVALRGSLEANAGSRLACRDKRRRSLASEKVA